MDKERGKGGVIAFIKFPPTFIPNINFIALSEPFQGWGMKEEQEQIAFKFYRAFPLDGTDWDASPSN